MTLARNCLCPLPLSFSLLAFLSFWMSLALQRGARQTAQEHLALWCAPRETGLVASPGLHCLANMSQFSLGGIIAGGCERKSMINNKLRSVVFLGFSAESIGKGVSCGGDVCCVDRCHPGKSFIVEVFTSYFVLSEHLHSWQISYKLNVAQGLYSETPANTN